MLNDIIGESWLPILQREFDSEYMQKLANWLHHTRESKTIYPDSQDVFRALKLCPYGQVKVIILGQDPYHNGQADGLCFSYKDGLRHNDGRVQSLDVILKEIENDVYNGFNVNYDYDLSYLAKQGVLLLNTVLTVFRGKANSHANIGWEDFTGKIILSQLKEPTPKIIMLWGKEAKNTFNRVVANNGLSHWTYGNHLVLEAPHPASDLYKVNDFKEIKPDYPNTFTGCKHFSKANEFLAINNMIPINWFNTQEPFFNTDLVEKYQPF